MISHRSTRRRGTGRTESADAPPIRGQRISSAAISTERWAMPNGCKQGAPIGRSSGLSRWQDIPAGTSRLSERSTIRPSRKGCIWRFRRWRIPPEAPHNGRCGQDRALDFIVLKISLPEARFFCEKSNVLACGADIFETMKITSGSSALHWSDPPGCGASWRRPLLRPAGCVPWTGQARRPGFPASADRRAACVRPR